MGKKIITNYSPEETRMAILEDEILAEVVFERSESGHIVGNIYKGKINNLLPGMQAAFIDIGREKNAFLYIGDNNNGVLTAGQELLIQIVKDAIGTKGPRATTNLTIPGRYVVLMPTVNYIGISRRISDEVERERLKAVAEKIRPDGMGIIVRTVAEGKTSEDLEKDIEYLYNLWTAISARAKRSSAPTLLYRDVDLIIRIVRDYMSYDVSEFILDNRDAYMRVCDLLKYISPELAERIKLYTGSENIFAHYGIDDSIEQIFIRQVPLKCGGYLVIDQTEALTVIDVNTGSYVGDKNLADTVFKTNIEAAEEIARQLKLRDIGGIIIIDFIDMDTEECKQAVLDALEAKLKLDRTKTNVLGLTSLGLVEMTRKKMRRNLSGLLYTNCPCCDGRGKILSPETVAINIRRHLRKLSRQNVKAKTLVIQVHPSVAQEMNKKAELTRLETEIACSLIIESVSSIHPETFCILQHE